MAIDLLLPLLYSLGLNGLSTDLCTGLIKNVIARYLINGSQVLGCFLDASKTFDRVDHAVVFDKLLLTRALRKWYTDQRVNVSWNNCYSDKFSVSNGVHQGGMLSPILFTVYIDDLLFELEKNGVAIGCYWNHHFVGVVCYADDIALLAPSPSALRLMLKTCSHFASTHRLIFNANKTQLVRFSHSNISSFDSISATTFYFGGQKLRLSQSAKHLGHILCCNLSIMKTFPPSRRISLAKLAACCTPFPVVIHSLKLCSFAVFASPFTAPLYGCPLHPN